MSNDKSQATYGSYGAAPQPAANLAQMRAAKKLQRDGWAYQITTQDGTMVFYRKTRIKKRWLIFWSIVTLGFGLIYFAYAAANRRTETRFVAIDGSVA